MISHYNKNILHSNFIFDLENWRINIFVKGPTNNCYKKTFGQFFKHDTCLLLNNYFASSVTLVGMNIPITAPTWTQS